MLKDCLGQYVSATAALQKCRVSPAHPDVQLKTTGKIDQLARLHAVLHADFLAADEVPAEAAEIAAQEFTCLTCQQMDFCRGRRLAFLQRQEACITQTWYDRASVRTSRA